MVSHHRSSTASPSLKEVAERYFSEEYLFQPENAFFRNLISPVQDCNSDMEEGTEAVGSAPPLVPLSTLLGYRDVQEAAERDAAAAAAGNRRHHHHGKASSDYSAEEEKTKEGVLLAVLAKALEQSELACVVSPADTKAKREEEEEQSGSTSLRPPCWRVRRGEFLDETRNPSHRTVVARPLPPGATLKDMAMLLNPYGSVETMRVLPSGVGSSVSGAHHPQRGTLCAYAICMDSEVSARKVADAFAIRKDASKGGEAGEDHHHHAENAQENQRKHACLEEKRRHDQHVQHALENFSCCLQSSISERMGGRPSLPSRVFVSLFSEYEESQRAKRREREEQQLQRNIHKAQTLLARLSGGNAHHPHGDSAAAGGILPRQSLARGAMRVVQPLPASVHGWAEVKTALGNLVATDTFLKKGIRLVHVQEPVPSSSSSMGSSSSEQRIAFVVFKCAQVARDYVTAFDKLEGKAAEEMHKVCPSLSVPSAAVEEYATEQYPLWCGGKVESKVAMNRKRYRK